ncbi:unnamed protein product [Closterium sp. Naga37s-1]|nr:unnamed protein product [Closterium sp. Naga37s-1]
MFTSRIPTRQLHPWQVAQKAIAADQLAQSPLPHSTKTLVGTSEKHCRATVLSLCRQTPPPSRLVRLRPRNVPSASNGSALLVDPYAGLLTAAERSERERESGGQGDAGDDAEKAAGEAASYLVATRFLDDAIEEAVAQLVGGTEEVRQVVLLADGCDTRPYRMAWPRPMVVFDVSPAAPYTACHKLLLEAGARPACGSVVLHVSADLSTGEDWRDEGWGEKLQRLGYRGDRPSLWVVQGLPHLSPSGLKTILGHLQGLLMAGCQVIGELPLQAIAPQAAVGGAATDSREDSLVSVAALSSLFASHGLLAEVQSIASIADLYAQQCPTACHLLDHLEGSDGPAPRNMMLFSATQQRMSDAQVDRILYSSVVYPHNYGFIPRTLCDDNDPMDVLVLMQGEMDDKIIAVCADDPEYKHFKSIDELPRHRLQEIKRFFEDYKKNENKEVAVNTFLGATEAIEAVKKSMDLYGQYILDSLHK